MASPVTASQVLCAIVVENQSGSTVVRERSLSDGAIQQCAQNCLKNAVSEIAKGGSEGDHREWIQITIPGGDITERENEYLQAVYEKAQAEQFDVRIASKSVRVPAGHILTCGVEIQKTYHVEIRNPLVPVTGRRSACVIL